MGNFLIDGYYKDDKTEFSGYLVSETDDHMDDEIFFYGLSEEDIKDAIKLGDDSNIIDFVITSYEKVLSSEELATTKEQELTDLLSALWTDANASLYNLRTRSDSDFQAQIETIEAFADKYDIKLESTL